MNDDIEDEPGIEDEDDIDDEWDDDEITCCSECGCEVYYADGDAPALCDECEAKLGMDGAL